ncbi:MAG: histidine phosphatase family protein [Candidatus Omnitrophica bacterium]|nr:histidine phosphatase family protein [Candidatus Omnitrophota bacterium]
MKRLYLVRHAQTDWNQGNRIQGSSDIPLSALGQQQARQLGRYFASSHLRNMVTSPLVRSQQTGAAILAGNGHGVVPVVREALAEMHLGAWEGLTPEEVDAQFAGAYARWRRQPSAVTIPGAEPFERFQRRVREVFGHVIQHIGDGEHVVVSHGGVIACVLADLFEATYDAVLRRMRLDNAGVTALECGEGTPHVLWVNDTAHLEGLPHEGVGWF